MVIGLMGASVYGYQNFETQRREMVEIVRREGVSDLTILEALGKVPRHNFVPKNLQAYAYENRPLPIGLNQTISQPYIVAFMTQAANLSSKSKVLEIGTGCGYQTAILAEICRQVFTVEILKSLADGARGVLQSLDYHNIQMKLGDGHAGWVDQAPFDAILVTAASKTIPMALLQQLAIGGCMILPLQNRAGDQILTRITKNSPDNAYTSEDLLPVRFVPMTQ